MKDRFCLALVLTFFGFVAITAKCQEAVTVSNDPGLPSAPSAISGTTCTGNNGKPCSAWLHKLIGQYPPPSESEQFSYERDPHSVHLWTYRGWQDPPLRSNRQVFRSKVFLATHIGGAIAMVVACRTKKSGEDWTSEVPAVAALFGMDYVQFRFVGGLNALGAPIYEMIHYGRASTR